MQSGPWLLRVKLTILQRDIDLNVYHVDSITNISTHEVLRNNEILKVKPLLQVSCVGIYFHYEILLWHDASWIFRLHLFEPMGGKINMARDGLIYSV